MNKLIFAFSVVVATVLLNLISFVIQAQQITFESEWRKGAVVLTSGDTIYGSVILTLPNDLIRITQAGGTVSAFSAVNVSSFEVQGNETRRDWFSGSGAEATLNLRRQYITLPWNHDKDYSNFKSPAFFVLLQPGNYALLMRENKERIYDQGSSVYNSGNNSASRTTRDIIKKQFYLLNSEQNIIRLSNPKSDIFRIFSKQQKQISVYAKENRLSFTDAIELAQIVAYANSLIP